MKRIVSAAIAAAIFLVRPAGAQVPASGGTYVQNFDSLAAASTWWTNNLTLPGWYTSKAGADSTNTLAGAGTSTTGGIYSFATNGINPANDRALGSVAGSSTTPIYFGVRFTNDTGSTVTNILVSYSGEQWRAGSSATVQKLAFSCLVSSAPITNSHAGAGWASFVALDFSSPNATGVAAALDGNAAANRTVFSGVPLAGMAVLPGQEFFLRWQDVDDAGNDSGLAIDNLTVSFQTVAAVPPATNSPVVTGTTVTLMQWNVKGNGAPDWSTNASQVQSIGRIIRHLNPDVVAFNEIPYDFTGQMANWVTAFMPGFYLATNSGTDGTLRSVIASRFPINRSQKWLDGADLDPFGYTTANFTRDLFEAEINVPNWPLPLHVFTTHLKATTSSTPYAEATAKRAAEAAAITNFFATNFFALYPAHPFTLSGDMNESDTNSPVIQRLISAAMTTRLTNPTNPTTGSFYTFDSPSPNGRIDYIFPGRLLATNTYSSQVFRTDVLTPTPTNLLKFDSTNASDHLPVLMTFANPFNTPFKILSCTRTNLGVTLKWESATNRQFSVETSTNLGQWTTLAGGLFATGANFTFATNNVADKAKFFRVYRVP